MRLVDRAPYAAFGGWWTAGVNPLSDSADEVQNFFAWLSSPAVSLEDVITDGGSTPFRSYRYSHLKPELWTDKGRYYVDKEVAEFTDATNASLESENVMIDMFPSSPRWRRWATRT